MWCRNYIPKMYKPFNEQTPQSDGHPSQGDLSLLGILVQTPSTQISSNEASKGLIYTIDCYVITFVDRSFMSTLCTYVVRLLQIMEIVIHAQNFVVFPTHKLHIRT